MAKRIYEENYNSPVLVDMWEDFLDWDKRRSGEKGVTQKMLKEHNCKKIFDASLGDGCDSIQLLKNGFEVTSNEIDSLFVERSILNARKNGVDLEITKFDWREIIDQMPPKIFDAVLLLGNSLGYLFSKKDQLKTLKGFWQILKKGGIVLVDERNYQYILDNREQILNGDFRCRHKTVYCGEKVDARPVEIRENKVKMRYEHEDGRTAYLTQYPFKKGELKGLIGEAGFKDVRVFSDYMKGFSPEADFYEYLAVK